MTEIHANTDVLAQRLLQVAWLEMRGPAWSNWNYADLETAAPSVRRDAKARVDATVAAVLRELAKAEKTLGVGTLLDLAERMSTKDMRHPER